MLTKRQVQEYPGTWTKNLFHNIISNHKIVVISNRSLWKIKEQNK